MMDDDNSKGQSEVVAGDRLYVPGVRYSFVVVGHLDAYYTYLNMLLVGS